MKKRLTTEDINPYTGKTFSKKFIDSIDYEGNRFRGPWSEEKKKAKSLKMKMIHQRQKTFQEVAQCILNMKPTQEVVERLKILNPYMTEEEIDNRAAMIHSLVIRALTGDPKAFEVVRDTAGEKPVDKSIVESSVNTTVSLSKEEIKSNVANLVQFFNKKDE